jgi:hypothetical protein
MDNFNMYPLLPPAVLSLLMAAAASAAPIKSATPRKRTAPKKTTNEKGMEPKGSGLIKDPCPIEMGQHALSKRQRI